MSYYLTKTIKGRFEDVLEKLKDVLKTENIHVITTISVDGELKKRLGVDYKKYHILGTCDPLFALRALQSDDKIGTLMPCNILVIDQGDNNTEIAVVNTLRVMKEIENPEVQVVALEMKEKFERVLSKL